LIFQRFDGRVAMFWWRAPVLPAASSVNSVNLRGSPARIFQGRGT